ncbi:MAG: hypothetical protein D6753_11345 [Planctomycetota bacterium]|nr:MAG: hypothetical protein D6753_11345 [Planctomycetota bacterium]
MSPGEHHMLCPKCAVRLERSKYEDLGIRVCPQCHGMLVRKNRLEVIRNRRDKSPEQLVHEIAEGGEDSMQRLRCPECRVTMRKERHHLGPSEFWIDVCTKCELVWLDPGELAKLQLAFELSEQGAERAQLRQRLANMTPEEQQELQERIAQLPESPLFRNWFLEGLGPLI